MQRQIYRIICAPTTMQQFCFFSRRMQKIKMRKFISMPKIIYYYHFSLSPFDSHIHNVLAECEHEKTDFSFSFSLFPSLRRVCLSFGLVNAAAICLCAISYLEQHFTSASVVDFNCTYCSALPELDIVSVWCVCVCGAL